MASELNQRGRFSKGLQATGRAEGFLHSELAERRQRRLEKRRMNSPQVRFGITVEHVI